MDLSQQRVGVSCAVTLRTVGRLMKTLSPDVARVLKRLHYPSVGTGPCKTPLLQTLCK
jgi:uncharacterized protein YaaW (UPF0174 family)